MPYYAPKGKAPAPSGRLAVTRWRKVWIPLLCAIPVVALLIWAINALSPEPQTAQEILNKQSWTPEEIARAMGLVHSLQTGRAERDEAIDYLRRQVADYPPEVQAQIRADATRNWMRNSLAQFRALPADRRAQIIARMQENTDRALGEIQKRSGAADLDKIQNTPEGEAFSKEVAAIAFAELTTDERREFHGLIQTWTRIMQTHH